MIESVSKKKRGKREKKRNKGRTYFRFYMSLYFINQDVDVLTPVLLWVVRKTVRKWAESTYVKYRDKVPPFLPSTRPDISRAPCMASGTKRPEWWTSSTQLYLVITSLFTQMLLSVFLIRLKSRVYRKERWCSQHKIQ